MKLLMFLASHFAFRPFEKTWPGAGEGSGVEAAEAVVVFVHNEPQDEAAPSELETKFVKNLKLPTAKAWGFLVGHYGGTPRFFLAPRMVEQLPCGPHPLGVGVLPSQRGLQRATLAGWSNVRCLEALDGTPGERSVSTTLLLSLV